MENKEVLRLALRSIRYYPKYEYTIGAVSKGKGGK